MLRPTAPIREAAVPKHGNQELLGGSARDCRREFVEQLRGAVRVDDLRVVRGDQLSIHPSISASPLGDPGDWIAWRRCTRAANKRGGQAVDGAAQPNPLGEATQGLRPQPLDVADPLLLVDPAFGRLKYRRHRNPTSVVGRCSGLGPKPLRQEIQRRLPVARHERVHVDQQADALAQAIGRAGDGNASVAVGAQDDVVEVLGFYRGNNVLYVRAETDVSRGEVRARPCRSAWA